MTQPRAEHPKPQMKRKSWINLNGEWDFAFDMSNSKMEKNFQESGEFTHKITVPFCPESELSGIGFKDFMPAVWYKRKITLDAGQVSGCVRLHFGAVDYFATVWVNDIEVGIHKGGYSSFCFDITHAARIGENKIVVCAKDDIRSANQPAGKQSERLESYGCMYTRTTGIWQTVWLEFAPRAYVESIKIIPDAANGSITYTGKLYNAGKDATLTLEAFYESRSVGKSRVKASGEFVSGFLPLDEVHLWNPGEPELYDLKITLEKLGETPDIIESYFGLRSIDLRDYKFYLNGRPVFQRLILDQGFYPDGIYTAPSDEALINDIKLSMDLGFNGARLHEKIFEERFLYHADRMGYMVWGEHANWGLDITTADGIKNFLPEWIEAVERDFNHPSIIGWCPFNETWDTAKAKQDNEVLRNVYLATKAVDPTRPVIDTSGNYHVVTDIYDIHDYEQDTDIFAQHYGKLSPGQLPFETHPLRQRYDGKTPLFMSEYGGAAWDPDKRNNKAWGYGDAPRTQEEVLRRYREMTTALLQSEAFCALCYTQLTDVEQEVNGMYTYDRKRKFSDDIYDAIREVNQQRAAVED